MTALDLSIPPQRKPDRESFDYRRKAVDAWLNGLPAANLDETGRAIAAALAELNRLQLRPSKRLWLLERIDPRLDDIIPALRRHYPPRELPLPAKHRFVAELALALLREMAIGYDIVIRDALSGPSVVRGKRLALALFHAIDYYGRLLLELYNLYLPLPTDLWRALHRLYLTAERRRLHNRAIHDRELGRRGRSTIAIRYRRLLLLAITDPYRLRPGEALDAYTVLAPWARHCRLLPRTTAPAGAAYYVNLYSDAGPLSADRVDAKGHCRALDTAPLQRLVEKALAPRRWWRRTPLALPEDAELRQRLLRVFVPAPQRRFSRLPLNGQAQVVTGLPAICRQLARELGLPLADGDRPAPRFSSRDVVPAGQKTNDVWDLIYTGELTKSDRREEVATAPPSAKPTADQRDLSAEWRLLNISPGGYGLTMDGNRSARVQVGELVALRETAAMHNGWQIGVVRWLKQTPTEGVQLGVQVLGARPLPITLETETPGGHTRRTIQGVLLPAVAAVGQPVTAIAPALQFTGTSRTRLVGAGGTVEIEPTQVIENNGIFCQFAFRAPAVGGDATRVYEAMLASL